MLRWGFLLLSLFIVAAAIFSVQQQTSDAIVRRALRIEIAIADVAATLQDAETALGRYLATGNAESLQRYRATRAETSRHLTDLSTLADGIEEIAAPVAALGESAAGMQAKMERALSRHGAGAAPALPATGGDGAAMDRVRGVVASIDAHQDQVVERRQARVRRIGALIAGSTASAVLLLGCVALAAMREVRRRGELSRFLPAEIAHRLAEGDSSLCDGRELPAAIVFVDIRGSTELAESLPIAALSALLSGFRAGVLAAAEANGGLVDKFIGDGALVVFGAHDREERAAAQALAFVRDLRNRHAAVRTSADGTQVPPYDIGMGVHHGATFCGIVGTPKRREFTVLGDTVNVAARLEKTTKAHGVDLLVSDAVLRQAGEPMERWRELPCETLQERRKPIAFFTDRPAVPTGT